MTKLKIFLACLIAVILGSAGIAYASSITIMQGSDTLSSSRSVINNNFVNLNNGKTEGVWGTFLFDGDTMVKNGMGPFGASSSLPTIPALLNFQQMGYEGTGSNLVPNGDFAGNATGWTLTNGFAYSSNNIVSSSLADLNDYSLLKAGTGFTVSDTLTTSGCSGNDPATFQVNAVDGDGAITDLSMTDGGSDFRADINFNGGFIRGCPLTGGTGSGAAIEYSLFDINTAHAQSSDVAFVLGQEYEFSITLGGSGGSVAVFYGEGAPIGVFSGNGTHVAHFVAQGTGNNAILIVTDGDFGANEDGTISNVDMRVSNYPKSILFQTGGSNKGYFGLDEDIGADDTWSGFLFGSISASGILHDMTIYAPTDTARHEFAFPSIATKEGTVLVADENGVVKTGDGITIASNGYIGLRDYDDSPFTAWIRTQLLSNSHIYDMPDIDGTICVDGGEAGLTCPAGAPGGLTTQLQYNNSGDFAGMTGYTFASSHLDASTADGVLVTHEGYPFLVSSSTKLNTGVGDAVFQAITSGTRNTGVGMQALQSVSSGGSNSAFGFHALGSLTDGTQNTGLGDVAGSSITSGTSNTLVGYGAGIVLTTGNSNVAIGNGALSSASSTTDGNTAIGYSSMQGAGAGQNDNSYNTAVGMTSLYQITTGDYNTVEGYNSAAALTTGSNNVVIGAGAMTTATSTTANTAVGYVALSNLRTGAQNTGIGNSALQSTTYGDSNVAIGISAGSSNTTGSTNTFIGGSAGTGLTTGTNNIFIGYNTGAPSATASNQLNIGNVLYGSGMSTSFSTSGKIGIATTTPATTLDVNGLIRVYQTSTTTCATAIEGSIFYNGTTGNKHFYGCDGTNWKQLD